MTSSSPPRLLAKSAPRDRARPALGLAQHCIDTETAALALFGPDTRWGANLRRFFRVDDGERFLRHLRIAALFHDLGKANHDFQRAVTSAGFSAQALRHEHISALVLCVPEVRAWLEKDPTLDPDAITAAVLSHHLKADRGGDYAWCQPRGLATSLALYLDHADVAEIFARVRAVADLPPPPPLPTAPWSANPPWEQAQKQGLGRARQFVRALRRDAGPRRALTLALKAGLIAADSAASGLVRTGNDISAWIASIAAGEPLTPAKLRDEIITPRIGSISSHTGVSFRPHSFQEGAAGLGDRALLLAGCGSGKTLAAWMWAERRLAEHRLGHVLFLYPTRGTATEGFRDYVGWAPEDEAALVHATASYELEAMVENPSEAMDGKNFVPDEAQKRLFALGLWSRRWFSATVDQFLSFLVHRYQSMCLLPLLADSVVILDEIHSYDRRMFRLLVAFLEHFDVPVLCMTATLPRDRRRQLEDLGLEVYPSVCDRSELDDLVRAEDHPRYRLHRVDNLDEALPRALDQARAGARVLCVVNTVRRCQRLARRLAGELDGSGVRVLAYHSRYRLCDRQQRHAAAVAAFARRTDADADAAAPGVVAVTTQVCEMSLDLDADVLLTELAPVPSLVQRCGRANRHLARGPHVRADVYLAEPEHTLPYDREDLAAARAFLDALGARSGGSSVECSQRDLADAFEEHTRREPDSDTSAAFIDSGYYAVPDDFRDIDAFSAACVLDDDTDDIEKAWLARGAPMRGRRRNLDAILPGYELSVPKRQASEATPPEWLPRYLRLAPAERYQPDLGFLVGEDDA
ncbi:CRISPR-associated helicase Cas3' [Haliangium sp.]|uniref:CRISPR-associated helicase Cas3' n=1 Tax=Haliangium sp. TaxID=2663208 RepID=UPI003D0E52AC